MFKSQLQEYAQKAGLPAPVYDVKKEGPSHEPQFKASVTIHGKVYESPRFFGNLKKAEHAAAEVALAELGKTETSPLHESGLCKNLLQEYAQKCKLSLPTYTVVKVGEVHSPTFSATVEIAGVRYNGGKCKTKKEAEIKAAKNALMAIYADPGALPSEVVDNQYVDEKLALAAVEAASEPTSGTKRKKKFKEGRKQKVKELPSEVAEEPGNSGTIADNLNGSTGEGSNALIRKVPKQEKELAVADSCTAAVAKIKSSANGSAQEQRA